MKYKKKHIFKIINEFINLNLLNENSNFDSFSEYIQNEDVIQKTKSLISILSLNINHKLFLSIWLIFKYNDSILSHGLELEKNILKTCILIIENIYKNSNNIESNKINLLLLKFQKNFSLWKKYDKNICVKEFIERYINVSKSLELISQKYDDVNIITLKNSLEKQLEDIVSISIKFDINFNKHFFENYYSIYKTVNNNITNLYWDIALEEFNNNNHKIFFENLELIKNILLEFYKNNQQFELIKNEKLFNTQFLESNLFSKNIFNKDLFTKLYLFIFEKWKNISSPIKNIDYSKLIESLNKTENNDYNKSLINFLKINFSIIQDIFLDLTLFFN